MPPLVDRPPPMTFTFCTDFTPITFSTDPTRFEVMPDEDLPRICAPPIDHEEHDEGGRVSVARPSHAKKRDASYIPRPPNAFILFRSSFIKSQQIPDKIEGNRSSLSKIIGIVWKSLPREEREHWEAQAVKAQAEHRQRYPHWRFRPCTNALAKVKDGPPRKRGSRNKGRDGAEAENSNREKRCAQIAGLLAKGLTGEELRSAIQAWDRECGVKVGGKMGMAIGKQDLAPDIFAGGTGLEDIAKAWRKVEDDIPPVQNPLDASAVHYPVNVPTKQNPIKVRSASPDAANARFNVPLTAMFKRASSTPLSQDHVQPAAEYSVQPSKQYGNTVALNSSFIQYDVPQPALSPTLSEASTVSISPSAFEWVAQDPCAYRASAQEAFNPSPPGSPQSTGTADSEFYSSPIDAPVATACQPGFFSMSSSLYGWAGDANHQTALPSHESHLTASVGYRSYATQKDVELKQRCASPMIYMEQEVPRASDYFHPSFNGLAQYPFVQASDEYPSSYPYDGSPDHARAYTGYPYA
ncbi:hypothetical protein EWM64_g1127 [Hericium alpestre]|uniref:HMG box domain-containing protein n=1 Tax=Hericium alpestre TaxID=135208 RepID=A0A4Z0A8M4_9AGAM|nr:hypothetical protein EWM64_g1127 [Hericium alpestre]